MQKKLITIISLTCLLLLALCLPLAAYADEPAEVTVLFTHDLHSHAEQYARLATLIDEQRALHTDSLLVDGGDFVFATSRWLDVFGYFYHFVWIEIETHNCIV